MTPYQIDTIISRGTYVSYKYKYLYVLIRKAACTTIQWALHDLENLPEINPMADSFGSFYPDQAIHKRHLYGLPSLYDLEPEAKNEILESKDWFRFALIRDPTHRVLSYWRDKVATWEDITVCRDITGLTGYNYRPIYFPEFIKWFIEQPNIKDKNRHWWSNFRYLKSFRNLSIYNMMEFNQFQKDFEKHLGRNCNFSRKNHSLPYRYEERYLELLKPIYAADYECLDFGANKNPDKGYLNIDSLSALAIMERNIMINHFREALSKERDEEMQLY